MQIFQTGPPYETTCILLALTSICQFTRLVNPHKRMSALNSISTVMCPSAET